MTTKSLNNMLLSWLLNKEKQQVRTICSLPPMPLPLKNTNFIFVFVSPSLRYFEGEEKAIDKTHIKEFGGRYASELSCAGKRDISRDERDTST